MRWFFDSYCQNSNAERVGWIKKIKRTIVQPPGKVNENECATQSLITIQVGRLNALKIRHTVFTMTGIHIIQLNLFQLKLNKIRAHFFHSRSLRLLHHHSWEVEEVTLSADIAKQTAAEKTRRVTHLDAVHISSIFQTICIFHLVAEASHKSHCLLICLHSDVFFFCYPRSKFYAVLLT